MKKIIALILALTLALTLAACNKSGDNPTGDNSTPGTSSTPGTTSKPSDTWADYYVADPSVKVFDEPETQNTEEQAKLEKSIDDKDEVFNIDIKNTIDEVYNKYEKYLNVNITKSAMMVAMSTATSAPFCSKENNITGISPNALQKVNDFLKSKGEEQLDAKNPKQNIAALWIAASLYFDPNYNSEYPYYYIAMPFGLARANTEQGNAEWNANNFWPIYVSLFDLVE